MRNKVKKLILVLLVAIPALADELKTSIDNPYLRMDNFPGGYSLSPNILPPLIRIYMKSGGIHKINPTPKQEIIIEKHFAEMFELWHRLPQEIKDLETSVMKKVVYTGNTPLEVKKLLDLIVKKRRELIISQIESVNLFKKILTSSQYKQILEMAEKFAQENQLRKVR